jgi:hypothetical protein
LFIANLRLKSVSIFRGDGKWFVIPIQTPATSNHVLRLKLGLLGALAEMHSGRRKDASLDLGRSSANLEAIVAQVGVISPVEELHTPLDSSEAFLGKSDGELDHLSRLRVRELGVVALVLVDDEDIQGHVDWAPADLLGHPNNRKP